MSARVSYSPMQYEEESGVACIFDCKFSPDGFMFAAADSAGYLTVCGFGSSELYEKVLVRDCFCSFMRVVRIYASQHYSILPPSFGNELPLNCRL